MDPQSGGGARSLVFSYLALRRAIGILGFSFPAILSIGALVLFRTGIQSSVSSYYHTGMRDVFVGTLCAIGFFLLSYRGYEAADDRAGTLACVFAAGVAFFPTTPEGSVSGGTRVIGWVHLSFAALFFATLIYFSLFLFTKTDPTGTPSTRKLQRNRVYRACGYTMSLCILLIAIYFAVLQDVFPAFSAWSPVFWLEAAAITAFGVSWLTKGEALLADEPEESG